MNFHKRLSEWDLIKNKAIKWMTLQNTDEKTVEEILQEVKDSNIVKLLHKRELCNTIDVLAV